MKKTIVLAVIMAMALGLSMQAHADLVELRAVEDVWFERAKLPTCDRMGCGAPYYTVYSGSGTSEELSLRDQMTFEGHLWYRNILLKFDLSSINDLSTINSASLMLYATSGGYAPVGFSQLNNDSWAKTDDPQSFFQMGGGSVNLGYLSSVSSNAWSELDITSTWTYSSDLADNYLSVYITAYPQANIIKFSSKEYGTGEYAPTLRLDVTSVVPEPISYILFVTGGTLLAGRRFIRRQA